MKILPKKQKQKLVFQLLESIIYVLPVILIFLVVSIIGTCLEWSPVSIVMATSAVVGNNIIKKYKDSKKTN